MAAKKKQSSGVGGAIAVVIILYVLVHVTPSVSTSNYTCRHLEHLWTRNGGSASTEFVAAEVGMAESSGNKAATSPNPDGGTNVGIWQLDTPGGEGAGYSVSQLEDPNLNARITVLKTNDGVNWSHWQTYVQGTYQGQC